MIVGIDLGTTNSLVAYLKDGAPRIIPNALGHDLTPSVVGLDDNGTVLVGMTARERLITHPERTAGLFKRYMGTDRAIKLGDRNFRAEELSALLLRSLKADAEAFLGESVDEAVITVPAYFSDAQRKATRTAGQLAGLKVERLLNEPTAAALAYGLHLRDQERRFLVFDLGGGTFDVSLLELFEGVMEVRASAGDNFLGGEDFVQALMQAFVAHVKRPELLEHLGFRSKLRDQAERAKRALSSESRSELALEHEGETLRFELDEPAFERLSESLLTRLREPIERSLRDAKLRARELDEVVLVGGATRMPMVRRLVSRLFGRIPASNLDPDRVVALGAAVQAGLKARDKALEEMVMTDVCPYTLGVEVSRYTPRGRSVGHYLPIIERNVVIPVSRVERVQTADAGQTRVNVRIFQGESPMVAQNIELGTLELQVPPRPAGEEQIDVRFTYDVDGILEVETTLVSTGKVKRLVIEGNPGVLTPEQISERFKALAALKLHPRDQEENRSVLARAARMYEQHLGPVRSVLAQHMAMFQALLEDQDARGIRETRARFVALLDQLEGESYL